jgi:hypothetical protein
LIDAAREALEQGSALLARARGEDWEAARHHLERAAQLMASAARGTGSPGAREEAAPALERFCRELRTLTALHRHAGAFYSGWMQLLAPFSGAGYSPGDRASLSAFVQPGRRVSLEG